MAQDLSSLFQLPLGEFVAARNALAARLKREGQADDAAHVKGLVKPSISAWVVNQLFWRHRKAFDGLLAAGEALRRAQAAQLAGGSASVKEPLEARRKAVAELLRLASAVVSDASYGAGPDMMRRVTTTLEALSTYGTGPGAPKAGYLTHDVDPPGFEALAALVPSGGAAQRTPGPGTVLPFEQKAPARAPAATDAKARQRLDREREAQRAAAHAAVKQAEHDLREARGAAARAEAAVKKAATRVEAAERTRREAERQLEAARAEVASAEKAARQLEAEAKAAANAVSAAERALERAKAQV